MESTSSDVRGLLSGEVELDETYFGWRRRGSKGRGALHKVSVSGILERKGKVRVEVVKYVSAKYILEMTIKTIRRGSIAYTDKFRSYECTDVLWVPASLGTGILRWITKRRLAPGRSTLMALRVFELC